MQVMAVDVRTAAAVVVHLAVTAVMVAYIADVAMPFYVYRPGSGTSADHSAVTSPIGWAQWPLLLVSEPAAYAAQMAQHTEAAAPSAAAAQVLNHRVVWRSSLFHIALAVITYGTLTGVVAAPYGRHTSRMRLRLTLPSRVSWMLQESPTLFQVLYFVLLEYPRVMGHGPGAHPAASLDSIAAGAATCASYWDCVWAACTKQHLGLWLFVMHYVHRSWVYPLAIPSSAHRVPLLVTWSATIYCVFNGRLQVLASATAAATSSACTPSMNFVRCWRATQEVQDAAGNARTAAVALGSVLLLCVYVVGVFGGSALFFYGQYANMRADYYLVQLRSAKDSDGGTSGAKDGGAEVQVGGKTYRIPVGGWFDRVSCANFFGELVEWTGYVMVVVATCAASNVDCAAVTDGLNAVQRAASVASPLALLNPLLWGRLVLGVFAGASEARPAALAAFSFLLYVVSNLVPRAVEHHAWYARTFGARYTALRRKAVIPGVY